jgi:hypothetical protein
MVNDKNIISTLFIILYFYTLYPIIIRKPTASPECAIAWSLTSDDDHNKTTNLFSALVYEARF